MQPTPEPSRGRRATAARIVFAVALSGVLVATGAQPAGARVPAGRTAVLSADKSPPRPAPGIARPAPGIARPAPGIARPAPSIARLAPARTVPAAAMLQPADLGGAATTTVTDDYWSALRPPQPCGPYPSARLRRAARAVQAMIGVNGRPSVILNDVASYPPDGAHQYLRQLRRAVATCDGWTILGTGVAGDESLLLRRREHIDYANTDKDTYVVLARTGRALVVVADTGWETADGHEAVVRDLAPVAVRRAGVVRL